MLETFWVKANRHFTTFIGCLILLSLTQHAMAQSSNPVFIRDAEIEQLVSNYAKPIFRAANLPADNIPIYIIADDTLNAFVTSGRGVFINMGLLIRSRSPNQVIGVIAHETGHILGGHFARLEDKLKKATLEQILGFILGIAAGAVANDPNVTAAVIAFVNSTGQLSLLSFSRGQEASADQAALSLLDKTGQSSRGLLEFFEIMQQQERLIGFQIDRYLSTHPLTAERIRTVRDHVAKSPFANRLDPPELVLSHQRMQAKLIGYFYPLSQVLSIYPETDQSLVARYGRVFAYYKTKQIDKAMSILDGLLKEYPNDPFFYEFKGQMLLESGKVEMAVAAYQQAVRLAPNLYLIRYDLARAMLAANDPALLADAIKNIEGFLQNEPSNAQGWRQLAIAYGKKGDQGMTSLAMAESAVNSGKYQEAIRHAEKATKILPYGSPKWQRADDIQNFARTMIKQR
ncbi:MAG TPA: M48 family metalloprotease [Alphaproteobacteria bacterium]|nr:M48 family metalloprotease [Alphaproteobacteria bacterium]